MIKEWFKTRKFNILFSLAAVILMWLVWIVAYYCVKNDYVIPSFQDTFISFFNLLASGEFWAAFALTLLRTLGAFAISFVIAAAFACLSSATKYFSSAVKPLTAVLRTLPTLAVILILLVWTNAVVAPIIVTVLVLFPVIYAQITAAVEGIPHEIKEMAAVYKIPKKQQLAKIYLPLVSPNVFSQTGANVSLGIKVMISAEVMANTFNSLGGLMQNARAFVDMPRLAALTVAAVVAGLLLDIAFSQLKRINRKWQGAAK